VSDRTQFPIGSVSKPLTAALALRQQERSALDLDRVVRT
jgi:CubicO group peptidase (beta-lactamase class C family)